MPATPQVCVFLDLDGNLHCEAPSHTGGAGRVKIDLSAEGALSQLGSISAKKLGELVLAQLKTQKDWLEQERRRAEILRREQELKDRKKQEQIEKLFDAFNERHRKIHDVTAYHHGAPFAERTIGPRSAKLRVPPTPTTIEI